MDHTHGYRLYHVKQRLACFEAFATLCVGGRCSLEGDLAQLELAVCEGVTTEEDAWFRRNTIVPRRDFAIVPLIPANVAHVCDRLRALDPQMEDVDHVFVTNDREVVLAAHDWFDDLTTTCAASVPTALLRELASRGVLEFREV